METINIHNNLHLLYLVVDENYTKLKITLKNLHFQIQMRMSPHRLHFRYHLSPSLLVSSNGAGPLGAAVYTPHNVFHLSSLLVNNFLNLLLTVNINVTSKMKNMMLKIGI